MDLREEFFDPEKMNEEVIHYSPNGIITFDEDNNIININDKAKEMFGINTPEVDGPYTEKECYVVSNDA